MRSFFKLAGKVIGRTMELLLGALGGAVWAAFTSLSLVYLARSGHFSVWLAVLLAVFAFVVLVPLGLLKPRVFMCYSVPALLVFLGGDGAADGVDMPVRPGLAIIAGFVALVALGVSAVAVSGVAFCVGLAALPAYWHLGRGIVGDLMR
jgi:hypothetical protein